MKVARSILHTDGTPSCSISQVCQELVVFLVPAYSHLDCDSDRNANSPSAGAAIAYSQVLLWFMCLLFDRYCQYQHFPLSDSRVPGILQMHKKCTKAATGCSLWRCVHSFEVSLFRLCGKLPLPLVWLVNGFASLWSLQVSLEVSDDRPCCAVLLPATGGFQNKELIVDIQWCSFLREHVIIC